MPAEQRGSVYTTSKGFGIQWRDETGTRRRQAGFKSRSEARAWFQDVEKKRMRGEAPALDRTVTFSAHVDRYLEAHAVGRDPVTIKTLKFRLKYAKAEFGEVPLDELERRAGEFAAWIGTLPAGSRYGIVQATRQALEAAVRWGFISRNPCKLAGSNPQPKVEEIDPFTQAEIDLLVVELGKLYGPAVLFASETGMRPSEWLALEWRDVDRKAGVVLVERSCAYGVIKSYGKTTRSRRRVPLTARALAALDSMPRRLDVRLVFPGKRGGVIDLANFLPHPVASRARVGRPPGAPYLRPPSLVRDVGARRRPLDLRARAVHGHLSRDDRSDVWTSREGRGGDGSGEARRGLRAAFGTRAAHERSGRGRVDAAIPHER
jgi:integrase